jgi:hypothetical protein
MVFHPDHTPEDDDSEKQIPKPVHPSRMLNFFEQYNKHSGPDFVMQRMKEIGAKSFQQFLDHEEAQSDLQQLVHQTEGHVHADAPLEDCDECTYMSEKHNEGAHNDSNNKEDMADREHCWHCKNENKN